MSADRLENPDAIYQASFRAIRAEVDLGRLPDDLRDLALRLIHSSGMTDLLDDLVWSEGAGGAGRRALAAGATVVTDVRMVAAGIARSRLGPDQRIRVAVAHPEAESAARRLATTRSAAGIELQGSQLDGAVVAIGNAPTALFKLLDLVECYGVRPALVLGFPVGFVGAAEAKDALAGQDMCPFVALRGRRGGSAMAAAAVNALLPDR